MDKGLDVDELSNFFSFLLQLTNGIVFQNGFF